MPDLNLREEVLRRFGAQNETLQQLLDYCENRFQLPDAATRWRFPLENEPHVADWQLYLDEAGNDVWSTLQQYIPQFNIPISEGISATQHYADVARKGEPFSLEHFGTRQQLNSPEQLSLSIHEHHAGALPVLHTTDRRDFDILNQVVLHRCEPKSIPRAVNAQLVAGFINWHRLSRYREAWASTPGVVDTETAWLMERARVAKFEKWRFQDRFLILCSHPYSDLSAIDLGLHKPESEWVARSDQLRMEHEFTHYMTKRVFGVMQLNILDEIIADWAGTTLVFGKFDAALFIHMFGIEPSGDASETGRVHEYTSTLREFPDALSILYRLTEKAAHQLQQLTSNLYTPSNRRRFLMALTQMSLELLASDSAEARFEEALNSVESFFGE
jgi:hypothetical protein